MRFKYFILLFVLVALTACIDDALFNGGATITKTIDLSDYAVIEAESSFEIELVADTMNKVLVTCGENLQKFVDIKVVDNVLYLSHDIKNNWSRKYEKVKLELHTKPFSNINIRKSIKLFNRDLYKGSTFSFVDWSKYSEIDMNIDVDNCQIIMTSDNFGHFTVKGRTKTALVWGWGSCIVKADSLLTTNCSVLHRGMGSVYVNASGQLDVSIEFSGNVYYSGNPIQINQHKTGSGNLYKKM